MVQLPTVSEADTRDALVETPCGDYELIDFGTGRKLERWGEIVVEYPDRLAIGEPAIEHWSADWVYVAELGARAHWESTRSGLSREWTVNIGNQPLVCRLDDRGRVGLRGREMVCAEWVRQCIEGCYDIDDIRVLNLFAGSGYVTAQALQAGASVVHVDASGEMLALSRANAGDAQVEYVHDDAMDYVEDLLRRQQRFDVIILPIPPVGHGPKGQMWDREVDMAKLVRYLPRLLIIVVTGDAYVDHPSFGMAIIGRLLEANGFRVGIIAQPDWRSKDAFEELGKPNLYFGVAAGNMDSMINRYTADKKVRNDDAYTPGGVGNKNFLRFFVTF